MGRHNNFEGYTDHTAGHAFDRINRERVEVGQLITTFKTIADLAGYDILDRITLENRESGAIYK